MNLIWSAMSPETRRMGGNYTELRELEARFAALRSNGEGYLEVQFSVEGSPQVSLGFRGDYAVVGKLSDLETDPKSFLLLGDGSVPADDEVRVPVMDEDGLFSGDFVMSVDRAWQVLGDFVRAGSVADLGEWHQF